MQFGRFESGGFYLHKIPTRGAGNGRVSAWFRDNGELTACELIDSLGRTRLCGKADKAHCELLGKVWRNHGKESE